MLGDDINDQRVPDQPHQHDEREKERHQPSVRQERMLLFLCILHAGVPDRTIHQLSRVPVKHDVTLACKTIKKR